MNDHIDDDMIEYTDEFSGHDFVVSLTDIMRCVKVAEERFLVPSVQPVDTTGGTVEQFNHIKNYQTVMHGTANSTTVVQTVNEVPKC
tara:strand:- start:127 stop:387 length:261 start_codon:yes stop_codon:yes gene_type:complete